MMAKVGVISYSSCLHPHKQLWLNWWQAEYKWWKNTQISQFLKLRTGLPASITSKHFLLPTNIIKVTLNKENKDEDCEVKWQHHATVEAVDITHRKIQEICGATFFFKSPAKLVWQDQETQIN